MGESDAIVLARLLGYERANTAMLRKLVAMCRHEFASHSGLHCHDGDVENMWRIDHSQVIATIDGLLEAMKPTP